MALLRVFASHSSADNAFCQTLVKALRGAEADVWYDDERQRPRTRQLGLITERELRERPVFIVVLSPAALASQWVDDETRWAYNRLRRDPTRILLPVLAEALPDEDAIWLFLQDFKRIGATGSKPFPLAQAIAQTLRALAFIPAGAAPTSTTPQPTESVDDLIAHGKAVLAQKKYAEALPFFERATERDTRSFSAWFNLGYVNGNLGRYAEALAACDRALVLEPGYAGAWDNRGQALRRAGRYQEAIANFDRALTYHPNQATVWFGKAQVLRRLRRYDEALAAYDRAIQFAEHKALWWKIKGEMLAEIHRPAEALQAFDEALALDSRDADAWRRRAGVLYRLGRQTECLAACERALALEPGTDVALAVRLVQGAANVRLWRHAEALAAYDAALSLSPNNLVARQGRVLTLGWMRRYREAWRALRETLAVASRTSCQPGGNQPPPAD